MTHNPNEEDDELQIAQQILELTKIVREQTTIINKLKEDSDETTSTIKKWDTELQDKEIYIEKEFEETKRNFGSLEDKFEQQTQNVENKFEELTSKLSSIEEKNEHQTQNVENRFEELTSKLSSIEEKDEQQTQNVENKFEELTSKLNALEEKFEQQTQNVENNFEELTSTLNTVEEKFGADLIQQADAINTKIDSTNQAQETTQSQLNDHSEKTQANFDSFTKTIGMVGDGLEQLNQINQNHAAALEEQRDSLRQFKQKLKELVSLTKADQKAHFENFSRIVESYNENIRTELTITAHSLKESDTKILDEVSASFMPRKTGEELKQKIADLISELEEEARKTRADLIQGLEKNVQEYETTMKQQTDSIKSYQQELKDFQDEILSIIDRKVNEKFEVVFSLLSNVAVLAEELALLMKTSEIQIPSSVYEKDQTPSNAGESHPDQQVETAIPDESSKEENE